jgi:membrane protein
VYGAFAAVPLFLLWLYLVWFIVIWNGALVATLTHSSQNPHTPHPPIDLQDSSNPNPKNISTSVV